MRPRIPARLLLVGVLAALALGLPRDATAADWCAGGVCQEWVARYDGPASGSDRASALAVDGSGNVYVTGGSQGSVSDGYATIKYGSDGNQHWVARYEVDGRASALAVDGSGNVYVTGSSGGSGTGSDYATIKYDSDGNQQWVARYDGPASGNDSPSALALDGSGNVYVTGSSGGSGTGSDYATIKYDNGGNQQWLARYNGPANSSDWSSALAVDGSGNVYATGYSGGSGTGSDYATIKYDADGNQQWVARYNGPASSSDWAFALAVDGSGRVYVTGASYGIGADEDYATIKYGSGGNQQWVARYDMRAGYQEWDIASALAVDGWGNVYVTGASHGYAGTHMDYATIKYDSDGNQQWLARYNGPAGLDDDASALALDGSGNVYVTGTSVTRLGEDYPPVHSDYATIKYDSDGDEQWVARYDGPASDDDYDYDVASALAVDGSGNVYVTGESVSNTAKDYATIKYSQYASDVDGDGVPDAVDNCPLVPNADQLNSDGQRRPNGSAIPGEWASNPAQDKLGDACDADNDNDGLPDSQEFDDECPYRLVADSDGDTVLDGYEVSVAEDPCNPTSKPVCTDPTDRDGDGFKDCVEHSGYNTCAFAGDTFPGYKTCATSPDSDVDSCADWIEIVDVNGDRVANILDVQWVAKRVFDVVGPSDSDVIFDLDKNGAINILDIQVEVKNSSLLRPHSKCPPEG